MTENLLRHERSPYLLQHASNPVHWRPWGRPALDAALALNKPILLSVGYAACHWCHVMAHESFENPETAAVMNTFFICVKVDREERPEIDALYMSALQAMGRPGGWPLTMFLAPDGTPFWGGTYFPPEPRFGQPSFRQVLASLGEAWQRGDAGVLKNRDTLAASLARMARTEPGGMPGPRELAEVAEHYLSLIDWERGGLQGKTKFPNVPIFRFLWQEAMRGAAPRGVDALHGLLRAMSLGGVYDHLGGGFARYSTDPEWCVPHFEKMLYDNGQLLELLALAQADRSDDLYVSRAAEIVGWLERDMRAGGAFAASEDADSEGVEGKFYVWTEAEVDAVLGDRSARFKRAYGVTPDGNWEGRAILRRTPAEADEAELAEDRSLLLRARGARIRPGRDDKVLADWNALTICGLARAGLVFDRPEWLELAISAYEFLLDALGGEDERLAHAWRDGAVTAAGVLEDQAAMARAALALFEATGAPARLRQAIRFAQAAIASFADSDGSFFASAADAVDSPPVRPRSASDHATASGNGLMAEVFARLFHLTGDAHWRVAAERVIRAFSGARLGSMPTLLAAARFLAEGAVVVVTGAPAEAAELTLTALTSPDPSVCVLRAEEDTDLPEGHPAHSKALGAHVAAYVCRGGICGLPVFEPRDLYWVLREKLAGQTV